MIITVYRRKQSTTRALHGEPVLLGYLTFDTSSKMSTRYTPDGMPIDSVGPWSTTFDSWLRAYSNLWTLTQEEAFFCADPDLRMDEGL